MEHVINRFLNSTECLDEEQNFYANIMFNIAPVICNEKPSCIMTFSSGNRDMLLLWEKYNKNIKNNKDILCFELKRTDKYVLVMFYSKNNLMYTVSENESVIFLHKLGYKKHMDLEEFLHHLKNRFEKVCPHELGIFLGYPIKDVKSFIECEGKDCLMCGYWKVYHDVEKAQKSFSAYDKAKEIILNLIIENKSVYGLMKNLGLYVN